METHSQFIHFPIYLWETKSTWEQVPDEEAIKKEQEADPVQDVTDDEAKPPKTKSVEKKTSEWELLNKQKPLWSRRPSEVAKEDYEAFYKTFSKDYTEPFTYSHFQAEGDVEFSSLLFIPKKAPRDLFQRNQVIKNIKLFVRRVFITDEITDLLPQYLSFITVS